LVVVVGTMAPRRCCAWRASKAQYSSIVLRSDCLECKESSVGGCGDRVEPVRNRNCWAPLEYDALPRQLIGDCMKKSSTISRHFADACWPVCAVYQMRRFLPSMAFWMPAAASSVVFPAWRWTVITIVL